MDEFNRELALKRLFKTDNPSGLVNEIYNRSLGVTTEDNGEGDFRVTGSNNGGQTMIPKTNVIPNNKKIPSAILESYQERNLQNNQPQQRLVENYTSNNSQISLKIDGIQYYGQIKQNSKGQILYIVGDKKCFILTPSDLKNLK
jgi:hypothetical protein